MGLSYHTHLLKSKVVVSGIIFRNAELNKPTFFVLQNVIFTLFAANKANFYSIDIFPASVVTQFMVKV